MNHDQQQSLSTAIAYSAGQILHTLFTIKKVSTTKTTLQGPIVFIFFTTWTLFPSKLFVLGSIIYFLLTIWTVFTIKVDCALAGPNCILIVFFQVAFTKSPDCALAQLYTSCSLYHLPSILTVHLQGPETSFGASNFIPSWMYWQKLPRVSLLVQMLYVSNVYNIFWMLDVLPRVQSSCINANLFPPS